MRTVLAPALLLVVACHDQTAPAPAAATTRNSSVAPVVVTKTTDAGEEGNLLNIALGASVVSRTGELTLDQSALRAIDGDPNSPWNSPPDDPKQSIVFALPTLTRVEKIGARTASAPAFHVTSVQFDSSTDGKNFTPLQTVRLAATEDVQLFPVAPRDLIYLRVSILAAAGKYPRLSSVQALGRYVTAPVPQPIDGCWSVNGFPANFSTDRGRITGTLGGDHAVSFEGGRDGAVDRFVWASGPDFGFAAIDIAPDGKHLSGMRWYVEPIAFSAAESWFGEPAPCGAPLHHQDVAAAILLRLKRLPLYGLHFDANGALDEKNSAATLDLINSLGGPKRYKFVSREFRMGSQAANLQRSQQRLDALQSAMRKRGVDTKRFEWQAIGSDSPPRTIETEIQRVLYSVIELQPL